MHCRLRWQPSRVGSAGVWLHKGMGLSQIDKASPWGTLRFEIWFRSGRAYTWKNTLPSIGFWCGSTETQYLYNLFVNFYCPANIRGWASVTDRECRMNPQIKARYGYPWRGLKRYNNWPRATRLDAYSVDWLYCGIYRWTIFKRDPKC